MKEGDLTKCQRTKDRDRVWAAIYSHKFCNSLLARLWYSVKRRIRETSSNKGSKTEADGDKRQAEREIRLR